MSEIGHSTLLKFLVKTSKMSEQSEKTDSTIKSKVPGEQVLRGDYVPELQNENQSNDIAMHDYSLSPVITVTKEESTFTKGDLKLQKVIVSEDISKETTTTNNKLNITESTDPNEVNTEIHGEVSSVIINTEDDTRTNTGDQKVIYIVTKIPKLKFKQAVDKIKQGDEMIKEEKDGANIGLVTEAKLKDEKKLLQESSVSEPIKTDSPKVDDEFDKIYDEIFENGPPSGNFPSPGKIEDPVKLETKFEEIIHAYDEQNAQTTTTEKIKSKIPLLKRKSEQDIYEAKQTIRKNSLKKKNSIDEASCKLPVTIIREKQNIQLESNMNKSQISKNQFMKIQSNTASVFETDNTNIPKTPLNQKNCERIVTQKKEFKSISEVSKSKIPMHLKKNNTVEKTSNIQTSEKSSIETKNGHNLSKIVNKNDTDEPEKVVSEKTNKTLNVKDNIFNIETGSLIIKDNVKKLSNTNDSIFKKDITLNTFANDTDNRKEAIETEIKTHIVKKDVTNLKQINNLPQNERLTDAIKSNNDSQGTNNHSENNLSKVEVQRVNSKETNSFVLINQEVSEDVRIVPLQFSNSETKNIQLDQEDKTNDNIIKTITKDILYMSDKDAYLDTNPLYNNSLQEIKNDDSKNKLSDQNIEINDNINRFSQSTKNIREVNIQMRDEVTDDVLRINNEENSNNYSQECIINELVSLSAQKSIDPTFNTLRETVNTKDNKEMINLTINDNKQDKVLIPNEQSEVKVKREEITEEIALNQLDSQEYFNKLDNISNKINTEINNNETKTEIVNDNKAITVITNNNINSLENNGNDITEMEEEDITMLKGKVNRIISRLDSKEIKVNKCEPEDVPLEVSVYSKIALFEQSKSMDTTQKFPISKNTVVDEKHLDKPKIVDGILKVEDGALKSDSKFSYDTFLNYKKSVKNNLSIEENRFQTRSEVKPITNFDKIYNTNINLNNFNKNQNNIDLFSQNEDANRNIINEYKINKEIDMRRAKSLAELNYDGVQGRVRQMVVRMNSIDKMALERREQNEVRKKTDRKRHGSVSERIALFERDANEKRVHFKKKITPMWSETVSPTTASKKPEEVTPALNEEEMAKRIIELTQARTTYERYDNMTYIELSDGGRMPSLTVGTAMLDPQLVKPTIKAAIDLGYRSFDTAYIYGNEEAVGEAIREKIQDGTVSRDELFVTSKLWSTNHRRDLVPKACRQSLDIMGLDYFDLYLIHNPMSFKEGPNPIPKIANVLQYSEHDYLEAWFGIEDLIKEGLVKRGGVGNFNSVQVERVLEKGKIKPVVNQVECHPYLSQERMQDFLSPRGIAMSCFGCLGSSGTPKEFRSSLPPVIEDPLVRTMAAGLGVSPAQLLISYQLFLGRGVVVKASSAEHMWDDLHALDINLSPEHATALGALNRNKRTFTFEGMGDTHKNYPFKIPF